MICFAESDSARIDFPVLDFFGKCLMSTTIANWPRIARSYSELPCNTKLLSVDTNGETQAPLFEKLKNLNDMLRRIGQREDTAPGKSQHGVLNVLQENTDLL
jgi:hypothetical protein